MQQGKQRQLCNKKFLKKSTKRISYDMHFTGVIKNLIVFLVNAKESGSK